MKYKIMLYIVLTLLFSALLCIFPIIQLKNDQIMYLYSGAAQVVAGLFGLSIAGYVFQKTQNDSEKRINAELVIIVDDIAKITHRRIIAISILGILSIGCSFLSIATASNDYKSFLIDYLYNLSMLVILSELILIFAFGIQITDPKSREKHCKRQIMSFSKRMAGSSLLHIQIFELFGSVVKHCRKLESELVKTKVGAMETTTFPEGIHQLAQYGKIDGKSENRLIFLYDYINYSKYGNIRIGHQEIFDLAKGLVEKLEIPIVDFKSKYEKETGKKIPNNFDSL